MMTLDDFASAVGIDGDILPDVYSVFCEELGGPQKTLAARSADLAQGLRRLGVEDETVFVVVHQLALELRR